MPHVAPLRLGSLILPLNLCLAPLAGYTSLAFRRVVRAIGGVGLATTEVVSARLLRERNRRTLAFLRSVPEDRPLAVQIDAATPDEARDAVAILEERGVDAVDLNMGCPVRKLARKGKGAALAREADEAAAVARAAVEAARRVPITAKMRLGWEEGDLTAPELARALEQAGVAGVAVHGRRRAQSFRGAVDRAGIRAVVEAVSIPVLGNGDIDSPAAARAMFEETGCAGVLIGRAAIVNPFIFRETRALLETGEAPPPAPLEARIAALREHHRLLCEDEGEARATFQIRKVLRMFGRAIGAGDAFHAAAGEVRSPGDIARLLESLRGRRDLAGTPARAIEAVPVPDAAPARW